MTRRDLNNIVAAAYPTDRVRFRHTLGAFLAGTGVGACVPAKAGQLARLGMLRRRVVRSATFAGLASTLLVGSALDAIATAVVAVVALVTGQIADALAGGTPPAEILVLARTGYATEPLQRALAHAGIPHRVLGSLGLYERTEVRDALAYLTLIENPVDAQAFRRAIGSPKRGPGTTTTTPRGEARNTLPTEQSDHDRDHSATGHQKRPNRR